MVGITRIGGDIQDNANFGDSPSQSTIVKLATGGFIIIWSGGNVDTPAAGDDIRGQVFTSTGAKSGTEFVINGATAGDQSSMRATLLSSGNVMLAWQDSSQTGGDTSGSAIKGQVISATGARIGSEFLVNTTTSGGQYSPAIATLANGNVMVTWEDGSATGGDTSGSAIRGQVLTAAGVQVGSEFLVNTTTTGGQNAPRMATLSSGNVIIVWEDGSASGGDTSNGAIRAQIVDATGAKIGGEFLVNTSTAGMQEDADVAALAGGGFVVVWEDASGARGDASGHGINAQIFNGSGARVGGEFLVNTLIGGDQGDPTVAGLDTGDFVVAWRNHITTVNPARDDLRAQGFTATGARVGLEVQIDSPVANIVEGPPSIVALNDGRFVVASPSMLSNGTSRGVHSQLAALGREFSGTIGANALVGVAGADNFYASQGHDTIDGRGGSDRLIVNADDHNAFSVTTGSVTYTLAGNVLSRSDGQLDTTLTSVEIVEIFDTSAANHTFTDTVGPQFGIPRYFHFGSGDDVLNTIGTVNADLGLGNNVINASVGGTPDSVGLYVDSSAGFVIVTDSGGGSLVSYTTAAGASTTQFNNVEVISFNAVAGQGLRIDLSGATAVGLGVVDTPYDDILIGSRGADFLSSYGTTPTSPTLSPNLTDLSAGTDYKYGNGGADTYDYAVSLPTDFGDHIMDLDSDDILDFSYYAQVHLGPNSIFLGTGAFTGVERQIRYEKVDGKTYIYSDIDGNGVADGRVVIENGAFDFALVTDDTQGESRLKITLTQNFINGTTVGESLTTGTAGADVIRAYQGDDTIKVTSGQDFIDGGTGSDTLSVTISDTATFVAPNAARTYTIGADRLFGSSGALNTSFLGVEAINFSTVGAGNFGDTIDARQFAGAAALVAGAGNDTLFGGASTDTLNGGGGIDTLLGGANNDRLIVGAGGNGTIVDGGADTDTLAVTGAVSLGGLSGIEAIEFQSGGALTLSAAQFNTGLAPNATLSGTGALTINMGVGDSELYLQQLIGGSNVTITVNGSATGMAFKGAVNAVNIVNGGDSADSIRGSTRADILSGGNGNDKIEGGAGADTLTGGAGADTFRYQSASASGLGANADHITDFVIGTDRLGFTLIDADAVAADDQAFGFLGTAAFTNTGIGQIRYQASGADMEVQVDVNGDGVTDMAIYLNGLSSGTLTSADFLL